MSHKPHCAIDCSLEKKLLPLDQHIGVRIPGGQPNHSKADSPLTAHTPDRVSVVKNVGTHSRPGAESLDRPGLSPEELKAIDRDAETFLSRFAHAHAAAIARNTKAVRRRLLWLIAGRFQLKRGPKSDPQIVRAHQMLQQGVERRELLPRLVPGFNALDRYGQHLLRKSFYPKLRRYERSLLPASQKSHLKLSR
jgi:hypothetical protein